MPFCPGDLHGQSKRWCKGTFSFLLPWLFLTDSCSSSSPSQHEMSTFKFWASIPLGVHSSIIYSFPLSTGPWSFKVRCLIQVLSFATVIFHIRTHSTRATFLAVIKLLETHQYSCPHSCISFLLNVTGQTTICPFSKSINQIKFFAYRVICFWNILPNQIKNSNFKIWLDDFKKNSKKRIWESILGNNQMNYLIEFDLYLDIVLIMYMFCATIFF